MNKLMKYISSQFKNPKGFIGKVISLIQNIVNKKMYKKAVELVDLKKDDKLLLVRCC